MVHNLPVASALRAWFPEAHIDWVVEEAFTAIVRLHPAVRHIVPVAVRRWRHSLFSAATWKDVAAWRRDLRREGYDLVLDSQGLIKSGLITLQTRLAPGGLRQGYAAEAAREPLAARCYDRGLGIPKGVHAVERNLWLAAAACARTPDARVDYGIAAPPLQASWLPSAPYALLLTASSRTDKAWPDADWLALAAQLKARGLALLLPAATAADRHHAARLAARIGSAAMVAPPLDLDAIAGLCAGARLVIGVDTGLTHLATALRRPTLCLFTGSDPTLTGVYPGSAALSGAGPDAKAHLAALARNLGRRGEPPQAEAVAAAAVALLGDAP